MTSDDLMVLTMVMRLNNEVLRPHDHPQSRRSFELLRRSGAIQRVLPGTFLDAMRLSERRTRYAAALAASPGAVLWGEQAIAATTGTLDAAPFGPNERITLAHAQFRRTAPGIRWVRRRVPSEHRGKPDGLRCPSAAYLALEASGRDGGALIQRFLRERLLTTADVTAALPAFAASPGQDARRRMCGSISTTPGRAGRRSCRTCCAGTGCGAGWRTMRWRSAARLTTRTSTSRTSRWSCTAYRIRHRPGTCPDPKPLLPWSPPS